MNEQRQKCKHRSRLSDGRKKRCFRWANVGDYCRYHHPDSCESRAFALGGIRYALGAR